MEITIDAALQRGIKAHKSGNIHEAHKFFSAILKVQPNHPNANHNMGLLAINMGKVVEALPFFKASLKADASVEKFWVSYIDAHLRLNRISDAKHLFQIAEEKGFKGHVLRKMRLKLDETALKSASNYLIAGNNFYKSGDFERAIEKYEQALSANPEYAEAYFNKANALIENNNDAFNAIKNYKSALEINPNYMRAYNNLGNIFKDIGDQASAKKQYKTAIKISHKYATAHFNLAQVKKYKRIDKQFSRMKRLHESLNTSIEDRCVLGFALSKAYEDMGKLDKSFYLLKEANALRKQSLSYDFKNDKKIFEKIKGTNQSIFNKSLHYKTADQADLIPVFIVGMPRSGTTLIEQIISSHSQITGGGELNFVGLYGTQLVTGSSKPSPKTLTDFREKYLSALGKFSNEKRFVTDKMPHNFLFLGLICAALPEAKIVHVTREPRATCWSNFKHYFPSTNLGYCYDLNDLVKYYEMYRNLMGFWQEKYASRIHHVNYDVLTNNQNLETKKLIKYLEIGWERDCLYPQKNQRFVRSASSQQVREKIYKNSSKKWLDFEVFLNGAFEGLTNTSLGD
ncbi:MAG: sulfotransferase [Pseudomonadota bacterium]|nr:sulfotransferase [Pseudomonadota bacterium]